MSITKLFKINYHLILKRNVIETLYMNPKLNIKTILSLKASDDGKILCTNIYEKKFTNYNVEIAKYEGKFSKNAIHFPGKTKQRIIIDGNIFYNLNEFTISTWIKSVSNSLNPMTLVEVVPRIFLEMLENNYSPFTCFPNQNKDSHKINKESIEIEVFDNNNSYKIDKKYIYIQNFNKKYWNHIALSFKENTLYLFVNGKLIHKKILEIENMINKIDKEMCTVIGSSFLDESIVDNVYIDDFVIYDKALFVSDFILPNKLMHPNINNTGIEFSLKRKIVEYKYANINNPIIRNIVNKVHIKFDLKRKYIDKNLRNMYRFIF